jgi:hypothetical protein
MLLKEITVPTMCDAEESGEWVSPVSWT